MSKRKKYRYQFPIRKAIGMFVAAMFGFLMLSALGAYWALMLIAHPAPATLTAATVTMPTQTIKVYFSNSVLNPKMLDCGLVYPIEREVVKTPAPARAALNELLYGLSWDEANAGYFNSINQGVKINSLNIVDGVARADFDKRMDEAMGGSCRVAAIRAQITQTLMQFPTVKSVVISVDGNSEEALQP